MTLSVMIRTIMSLSIMTYNINTQFNERQHNDTQCNNRQHNVIRPNDSERKTHCINKRASFLSVMINVVRLKAVLWSVMAPSFDSVNRAQLNHPLDGITNPKNKLLHFLTAIFLQREEGTNF